jgi:hypothetical protein
MCLRVNVFVWLFVCLTSPDLSELPISLSSLERLVVCHLPPVAVRIVVVREGVWQLLDRVPGTVAVEK